MIVKDGSALAGLTVLDLGNVISAPLGAAILADLGADVIKIERPGSGDTCRANMPMKDGVSDYFVNFNRSKRGITLNMKSETGKEILRKLIEKADVLIENFRPGVMDKLGFSYDECAKLNPGIIYASVSGFGQDGPYSQRAGYDPVAQAMSGIMSVTGEEGSEGVRCGASIADVMAGQNMVLAILAALYHRNITGRGQQIDVALTDVCMIGMSSVNINYLTNGTVPRPLGNGYTALAPGDSYPTIDGRFVMLAGAQNQWIKLCTLLGHSEWVDMPEFATNRDRVEHKQRLNDVISAETMKYRTDDIINKLLDAGLPCGPILNVEQALNDEHFCGSRKIWTSVEHPKVGEMRIMNQSFKMSETNPHVRSCAPELGQHNEPVLTELGYSKEDILKLKENGII